MTVEKSIPVLMILKAYPRVCTATDYGTTDYGTTDYGTTDYGTTDYGTTDYGTTAESL